MFFNNERKLWMHPQSVLRLTAKAKKNCLRTKSNLFWTFCPPFIWAPPNMGSELSLKEGIPHLAHRDVSMTESSSLQSAAPLTRQIMAVICHHPHLFWLTFPFTDWEWAPGSAGITWFSHTAAGKLSSSPKSNHNNLPPNMWQRRERELSVYWSFDDCSFLDVVCCRKLGFKEFQMSWFLFAHCSETAEMKLWETL